VFCDVLCDVILFQLNMGFLDFLKGVGSFVKSGIQKVAGFVGKLAPVVSKVAGLIPLPQAQGIATAANLVGGVANAVNGADPNASQAAQAPQAAQVPAGTLPATQVPQVVQAAPQGPIM
jgi:hypothetical protein